MKKCICLLLAVLILAGCHAAPMETTEFVPLVEQTLPQQSQSQTESPTEGRLIELPGRVYDVPWQDRELLEKGGFTFTDSTIPVFLYTQEEVSDALAKVQAYVQKELLDSEGALRYTELLGIAPDFMATSEYVSPENRKVEDLEYDGWAQENYYAHYMDFDVIAYCDNAGNWGESSIHVYNVGLFRDDAADPTGWRVRILSRNVFEPAYYDLTSLDNGISYLEAYRPLTFDELETLGKFDGRVLFAAEMLYQENTTWVYIYKEETDQIIRETVAYSNAEQYIVLPKPQSPF